MSNLRELPELDTELLSALIMWAFVSEKDLYSFYPEFEDWGKWRQESWAQEIRNGVCQTAYCIAGQAVVQNNYEISYHDDDPYEEIKGARYYESGLCYPVKKVNGISEPVGDVEHISDIAQVLIGLTDFEADWMFHSDNNVADIVRLADLFAKVRSKPVRIPAEVKDYIEDAERLNGYPLDHISIYKRAGYEVSI